MDIKNIPRPEAVLFDYGHTLLYEKDLDIERGVRELFRHISKNTRNISEADYVKAVDEVYGKAESVIKSEHCVIPARVCDRVIAAMFDLEFDLTPLEQEVMFWESSSRCETMPEAADILKYLNSRGIKTGMVTNIIWSGEAMKARADKLIPNNTLEFITASSDYMFRKPSRILFNIALNKAGLPPEMVWYCGDNPETDVEGAAKAGIFPVWYDNDTDRESKDRTHIPQCEHLHIKNWNEMIKILDKL